MEILIIIAIAIGPIIIAYFIKNLAVKIILSLIAFFGFAFITFIIAALILSDIIGPNGVWLPFVFGGLIFAGLMLLVFKPFSLKIRRIIIASLGGIAVLFTAVFVVPPIYNESMEQATEEINLREYKPFGDYDNDGLNGTKLILESLVARLHEESTLQLNGELPRLDGATALYPLYSAFVRATYPPPQPGNEIYEYHPYTDLRYEDSEYKPLVACSTTPYAFENLIDGYADMVFLMGVSDTQRNMAKEKGLELELTPIGREAFVFFVNSRNSAQNLSSDDIRRIYAGEVTSWNEVGGDNNGIKAYQRPDESGSQTMLKQIMGDTPIMPAPMDEIFSSMMGMYARVADYRNYKNALGYSFLYYIRDMIGEDKVRFLSIDGIPPTQENIARGAYPFANDFYAVTVRRGGEYLNPERTENIDRLLAWMQGAQGQYLVQETGYVPIG